MTTQPTVEGYRLSPQQKALWRLGGRVDEPRLRAEVEIRGPLDAHRLDAAIDAVVARHDILRTRFFRPAGVKLPLQVIEEGARAVEIRIDRVLDDRHRLHVALPPLCADLGTLDRLLAEIALAYREEPLEPGPEELVQYVEFSEWRHHLLAEASGADDEAGAAARRFWAEARAAAGDRELPLPNGNGPGARPATGAERLPSCARRALDAETAASLARAARSWEADEESVLLAAWQALLARLADRAEIEIGRVTDGRTQEAFAPSLGPFSQWLPLRLALPDDARFGELPALARRTVERATEWLEWFDDDGAPAAGFELARWPAEYDAGRATLRIVRWELPGEPFRLGLLAIYRGDELTLELRHDGALSEDDAEGLLASYETLLRDGLRHPERRIDELALLPTDRATGAVVPIEETAPPDDALARGVHAAFAEHARRHPDRIAAICGGERTSYGELAARAARVAAWLRGHGVGPERPVALILEKGSWLPAAILGTFEAGGFYVPLDPGQPADYRRRLLRSLGAEGPAAVLTTTHHATELTELGAPVLALDCDWSGGDEAMPLAAAHGEAAGDRLAYAVFTSGSTGAPKGVGVGHRQLAAYLRAVRERLGLAEGARYGLLSSVAADLGNTALFPALACGGTLHLVPDERAVDPELAVADLAREPVDVLKVAPSHLEALLTASDPGPALPRERLVLGGEALRWELVDRVRALAPSCATVNHYGPTETTVGVLAGAVEADRPRGGPPPLGRPLAGVRAHVLDRRLAPLPRWLPGELAIGGPTVARGYLGAPARTAERFVPDPFSTEPGVRMYRTGDRVRRIGGGRIEFLGRVDDQVKIRGHRVEPGEVAERLRACPGVANAVVVARPDDRGATALVAYVVAAADADREPSEADLRTLLRAELPDPMVPARIVAVAALPLTPSGKIDRRALPEPDWSERRSAAAWVAPRTPMEELLACVWEDLLGIERAGVHDDFFELGGHSLLATQLLARVRKVLRVEVPLRTLFDDPTVAGLARALEAERAAGGEAPPIDPVPRDGREIPLSFSQQRVWFIERWEVDNAAYNVAHGIHLVGPLDLRALARAFAEIVRRHESLRTVFPAEGGRPRQEIHPPAPVPLPVVDLAGLAPEVRERLVTEITDREGARPVDLDHGPLLRLHLLRLGEEEHQLVTVVHLMAVDGWSLGVFIRELGTLYGAFAAGRPSPLPELPIQYADFAHWQRGFMEGEVLETHVDFWRERLGTRLPVLELPTDRPRPKVQTFRGHRITAEYPAELSARLESLARREGATLYVVLLAALDVLLYRYTGQDDVIVGSPTANRGRPELEGLIGLVVSTLVLRADLSGDPTARELLARVRETTLGAYDHPHVPLEHILRHLEANPDLSHAPVFQVLFVLQNMPIPDLELDGVDARLVPVANETAKFDLEVNVWSHPEGLSLAVEYNTDVFHEEMIRRLIGHYRRLLEAFADDPGRRISELPILSHGERERLLSWSDGGPAAGAVPVHRRFEERVRATPDAIALEHDGTVVSFRELDARATRLAARIAPELAKGAGEPRVAVHLDRQPELPMALLAVLKAGAAYVPIVTGLPKRRVAEVLATARPAVVLTTAARRERLPVTDARVLAIDRPEDGSPEAEPPAHREVHPESAAYVVFTSGSTGKPKGVVVPHRALAAHASEIVCRYELVPGDRVLQFASPAFDVAAEEIFPTWAAGATLVQPHGALPERPRVFRALIEERRLTVLNLPSSYWNEWIGATAAADLPAPASLRLLVLGSEAVPTDRIDDWRRLPGGGDVRTVDAYGTSETTVTSTLFEVPAEPGAVEWSQLPIGRPVGGTRAHVVDRRLAPVPQGVPGELAIAGACLARGYLDNPRATAERFVPDPFPPEGEGGERLYRTGDRARILAGGDLQLLGRLDEQVKIRGFRVEPGEVEAVLGRLPGVREAVVVAGPADDEKSPLRAFVVVEPDAPGAADPNALAKSLRERLPLHMLPRSVTPVEVLPRTATGKVDRRRLLAEEESAPPVPGDGRAPETPLERLIAGVWCDLLGLPEERIGAADDFFILGGHSMLATQALARLEELLDLSIPLPLVFEAPTVATLAPALEDLCRTHGTAIPEETPS